MSLMGRYENFFSITRKGLVFALKELKLDFDDELCNEMLNEYYILKLFLEIRAALETIKDKKLEILSNGNPEILNTVIWNSKLNELIPNNLSVNELKIFKPFLGVYQLAPAKLNIPREQVLFVSSNSWDAVGAKVFGFKVCWINRSNQQFEELDVKPDVVVNYLTKNGYGDMVVMSMEACERYQFESEGYFKLNEAAIEAKTTDVGYSHNEVFNNLKAKLKERAGEDNV